MRRTDAMQLSFPEAGEATPRSPGYGRAFGRVVVSGYLGKGYEGGRQVPLAGAAVRAYLPGTSTPWPDPLYLDEAGTTPATFPLATDESGAVALWAEDQGRLELECDASGYVPQRVPLDLEYPPDAAPEPVDAYSRAESDARYEPLDSAYTKPESDARYAALGAAGAVASVNGETGAVVLDAADVGAAGAAHDHDSVYVNATGDSVTGDLTYKGAVLPKITVQAGAPSSPATGDLWVW